jgi:putative DNA primase/helicase
MDNLQNALDYANRLSWAVFPVHSVADGLCSCGSKNCTSPGKHPRVRNGVHDATIDPAKIAGWWRTWPDANIGLATGLCSGIWVLDVDPRHGGDDTLFALEQTYGRLQTSVESLTGGGGRHIIFEYPKDGSTIRSRANGPGPGLDVRGEGGYVVVPPSSHISGKFYEWEATSDPFGHLVEAAPAWLQTIVADPPNNNNGHQHASTQQQAQTNQAPKTATAGGRNSFLTRQAGKLRRAGFTSDEIEVALLKLNQTRCNPPLPDVEVKKIAQSVSRYASPHQPTDDELADQWLKKYPDTTFGIGDFRRYKGGCWPVVPTAQIEGEILEIMENAKRDGFKPTAWKLKSIIELSRIKSTIANEMWNADKDMLVCQNGTLYIPTMTLLPHDKHTYITAGVAYPYDPNAQAPTWEYYCKYTLKDFADFLQDFAGYALTMDTSYETAVWLYGPPGCGKSTFIGGIMAMLGTRAGILGLADLEKSRFSLTDLPDKSLLVSTEQPSLYMQATEKVNALISGEPIQIDRKFRDPVIVQSYAKICWAMNELPRVGEANNGLFRRVKVVEFADLPSTMRSPQVKTQILTEGSGILNWSLAGLNRLKQNQGFDIPQSVIDATGLFKRANDIPSVFIEDACETDPQFEIASQSLYAGYRQWCVDNGHKAQSSTSIAMDWKRLGFINQHSRTGNKWVGLRLKAGQSPFFP